jgi:hypothetical protein
MNMAENRDLVKPPMSSGLGSDTSSGFYIKSYFQFVKNVKKRQGKEWEESKK